MHGIVKGYVDTSAGQVHYRMTPRGKGGLPLVLLHQTRSSSAMFEPLMAELAGEFWTLAPDTPGFGETFAPPSRPSIADYAQVLYDSLQAMGISECWLFGYHTGASIAVQMEYDHPGLARKLALLGPLYLTPAEMEARKAEVHPMVIQADGGHLMETWQHVRSRDAEAALALSHSETVLNLHAGERFHEAYLAVWEHDCASQMRSLTCPILLMAGEFQAALAGLESACAAVQNGTVRVIPKARNYVCQRQPEQIAAPLREFFV